MDDFVYNNEEERDMAQLHAIHLNMNAIASVRAKLGSGPGLEDCEACGEEIPHARRKAVQNCRTCVYCQQEREKKS